MEALFDLPRPPRPAPPRPAFEAPPLPMPALPLSCRACGGPLTDWCRAVDALPETGSWTADRIIAAVKAERGHANPTRKDRTQ